MEQQHDLSELRRSLPYVSISQLQWLLENCDPEGDVNAAADMWFRINPEGEGSIQGYIFTLKHHLNIPGTDEQLRVLLLHSNYNVMAAAKLFETQGGVHLPVPAAQQAAAGPSASHSGQDTTMHVSPGTSGEPSSGGGAPERANPQGPRRVRGFRAQPAPEGKPGGDDFDSLFDEVRPSGAGHFPPALAEDYLPPEAPQNVDEDLSDTEGQPTDRPEGAEPSSPDYYVRRDKSKTWREVRKGHLDAKLNPATVVAAKSRQPVEWPANLQLPLPEFRDPKTYRLFCSDPDRVPTEHVPPHPVMREMADQVKLGTIKLPLLPPFTRGMSQGEVRHIKNQKYWLQGQAAKVQRKVNRILLDFFASGKLPLSSLTPVGGKTRWNSGNTIEIGGPEWTKPITKVALAVVAGSEGFDELLAAWKDAGLPLHQCQIPDQYAEEPLETTTCMVCGWLAPEYMQLWRALAVITEMPQNLKRKEGGHSDTNSVRKKVPQEYTFCQVCVTKLMGFEAEEEYPTAPPPMDLEEWRLKRAGSRARRRGRSHAVKKARLAANIAAATAEDETETGDGEDETDTQAPVGRKRKAAGPATSADDDTEASPLPPLRHRRERAKRDKTTRASGAGPAQLTKSGKPPKGVLDIELTIALNMANYLKVQPLSAARNYKKFEHVRHECPDHHGYYINGAKQRVVACSNCLEEVLHCLLTYGSGLYIGPDSDGMLNYCDQDFDSFEGRVNPKTGRPRLVDENQKVAGIALKEYASMIEVEVKRLTTALEDATKELQDNVNLLHKYRTKVSDRFPDHQHEMEGNSDDEHTCTLWFEPSMDAVSKAVEYEKGVSHCRGVKRAVEIALCLAQRAADIFIAAGLIERVSETATPPPPPTAAAASGTVNSGAGPSNRQSSAGAGPKAPKVEPDLLPWVPDISIGLILAAEKLGGKRLLLRDEYGWVVRGRIDEVKGGIQGVEKIPAHCFTVDRLLNSVALPTDYEAAPVLSQLNTAPKMFQRQGLAWMLNRERNKDAIGRGLLHLDPAYTQFVTQCGFVFYAHKPQHHMMLTLDFAPAAMDSTCGGLICDEMGLGKTLESLMLIVSNPPPDKWANESDTYEIPEDTQEALENMAEHAIPIKTTLMVVPGNLIEQWCDEIKTHLKPGKVRWGIYHGIEGPPKRELDPNHKFKKIHSNRDKEMVAQAQAAGAASAVAGTVQTTMGRRSARNKVFANQPVEEEEEPATHAPFVLCEEPVKGTVNNKTPMSQLDIVLMSYEQLRRTMSKKGADLRKYGFWRIMLDEAQLVANSNSVAAVLAAEMLRCHAWVVTGTPISNRLSEIAGLCTFLAAEPFYRGFYWRPNIQTPYENHTRAGLVSMRALLRGLMIRRTKEQVESELAIPECSKIDVPVQLSPVMLAYYNTLRGDYHMALAGVKTAKGPDRYAHHWYRPKDDRERAKRVNKAMETALMTLNNLRQCVCHPLIVRRDPVTQRMGNQQRTLRVTIGSLLLKAYTAGNTQLASYYQSSAIQEALQFLAGKKPPQEDTPAEPRPTAYRPDEPSILGHAAPRPQDPADPNYFVDLMKLLLEVQAQGQLAALYDIRRATAIRTEGVTPKLNRCARDQELDGVYNRYNLVKTALDNSDRAGASINILRDPQQNLYCEPAGLPEPIEIAAPPATGGSGGEAGSSKPKETDGEGYVYVHYDGVKDTRPYGRLPDIVFRHKKVKPVLPPEEDKTLRDAMLDAGEMDLLEEMNMALKDYTERVNLWQRREANLLTLQLYVLKKKWPRSWSSAQRAQKFVTTTDNINIGAHFQWGPGMQNSSKLAAVQMLAAMQRINTLRRRVGLQDQDWSSQATFKMTRGNAAGQPDDDHADSWDFPLRGETVIKKLEDYAKRGDKLGPVKSDLEKAQKTAREGQAQCKSMMSTEARVLAQVAAQAEADAAPGQDPGGGEEGTDAPGPSAGSGTARTSSGCGAGPALTVAVGHAHGQLEVEMNNFVTTVVNNISDQRMFKPNAAAQKLIDAAVAKNEHAEEFDPEASCPICFTLSKHMTLTPCGHQFCTACLEGVIPAAEGKTGKCPSCRQLMTRKDIFKCLSVEEADELREAAALLKTGMSAKDYGTKIDKMVAELKSMRAQEPNVKALVMSSWPSLLDKAAQALQASGITYANFAATTQEARSSEMRRWQRTPECCVLLLLMSTSGGAAGLTLTQATTAFILEPSYNPGLEAQAAARIHRLGQDRPTRVIRILAKDTVEQCVLNLQKHKCSGAKVKDPNSAEGQAAPQDNQGYDEREDKDEEDHDVEGRVILAHEEVDVNQLLAFFKDV